MVFELKTKFLPTGATELIRTPEAAHSIARLFVKLSTAALAAPVWLSGRIPFLFVLMQS